MYMQYFIKDKLSVKYADWNVKRDLGSNKFNNIEFKDSAFLFQTFLCFRYLSDCICLRFLKFNHDVISKYEINER